MSDDSSHFRFQIPQPHSLKAHAWVNEINQALACPAVQRAYEQMLQDYLVYGTVSAETEKNFRDAAVAALASVPRISG